VLAARVAQQTLAGAEVAVGQDDLAVGPVVFSEALPLAARTPFINRTISVVCESAAPAA